MNLRAPAEGSRRPGLALVGLVLVVGFGLRYSNFLGAENLRTIALASAFVLIGSIGTMALLVSGSVDLSIGSQYALVSVLTALIGRGTGSVVVALLAALLIGAALGSVNGALVQVLDVSPLIVTLGTLGVYGGLAYAANNGQSVAGLPDDFVQVGRTELFGLPLTVALAVVAFWIGAFILTTTVTGLRLFAAGSNRQATALVGVPVGKLLVGSFAANGLLVGLVAFLSTAQLASGSPQVGSSYELSVLAAVILGGVAFTGGRGHPLGVFIAVAVVGVLNAGLIFAGLEDWWQQVAQGTLLLVALVADQVIVLRRERRVREGHVAVPVSRAAPEAERRDRGLSYAVGEVLNLSKVTVRFSGVVALDEVNLSVRSGEVVCLVGDNGAGKSTLAKVVAGAIRPSEGTVRLESLDLTGDPGRARMAGVETVFQELALCPNLNVADNLALGQEPTRRLAGIIPVRDLHVAGRTARARLDELGVGLNDLERPVRYLSGGERQMVQILRVMRDDVRLVIMDEPTSALGLNQAAEVRALVRAIAAAGTPVLLITHDVEEVFEVADRVAVLQRGRLVFDGAIGGVSRLELLRMMSGKTRVQAAQILEAVGTERKRIERDLHDGAQQGLVTSGLMLSMAIQQLAKREGEDDKVVGLLRTTHTTLQDALTEMRAFSRGLDAGVLERDGLVSAVRVLTDRAPVLAQLKADDLPRLEPALERGAYFVVAEAFTNALKYAEASTVRVSLTMEGSSLCVSVADDGIGFSRATSGSGLQGLEERVAKVWGVLTVDSEPGRGTIVSARFPIALAATT